MKKYFLISIVFLFCACDPGAIHEYYVQNNTESTITVKVLDYEDKFFSTNIAAGIENLIYFGVTINDTYEDEITYFMKELIVKKGNAMLNKDLLDYRIWRFEKTSRLKAKSYLTINSEDFE